MRSSVRGGYLNVYVVDKTSFPALIGVAEQLILPFVLWQGSPKDSYISYITHHNILYFKDFCYTSCRKDAHIVLMEGGKMWR